MELFHKLSGTNPVAGGIVRRDWLLKVVLLQQLSRSIDDIIVMLLCSIPICSVVCNRLALFSRLLICNIQSEEEVKSTFVANIDKNMQKKGLREDFEIIVDKNKG